MSEQHEEMLMWTHFAGYDACLIHFAVQVVLIIDLTKGGTRHA